MPIPFKPEIHNQEWVNGETKLNQTNLTSGVNQNINNLKTAVDGLIDVLGGEGATPALVPNYTEKNFGSSLVITTGGTLDWRLRDLLCHSVTYTYDTDKKIDLQIFTNGQATSVTNLAQLTSMLTHSPTSWSIVTYIYIKEGGITVSDFHNIKMGNPSASGTKIKACGNEVYIATTYPGGPLTIYCTGDPTITVDSTTGVLTWTNNIEKTISLTNSGTIADQVYG